MTADWKNYSTGGVYDELLTPFGQSRQGADKVVQYLRTLNEAEIQQRREAASVAITDTRATPIIRAEAVAAIRRGLRTAFSLANCPVIPSSSGSGAPAN